MNENDLNNDQQVGSWLPITEPDKVNSKPLSKPSPTSQLAYCQRERGTGMREKGTFRS